MTTDDQKSSALGGLNLRFQKQYKSADTEILRRDPPMPKNMMVELSNACNHACIFCTSPHMTRGIGRMKHDLLHRVMQEARDEGVEEIGFYTTGEPFIHTDLAKFTADAKQLGFRYIYISTNGALASPDRAKEVIDAGMDSIKFSINAGSKETYKLIHGHDDWDKVMANLKFISDYRKSLDRQLRLFISFIVTNKNAHETEAFRTSMRPLVDDILFQTVHNQSGQMITTEEVLRPGNPTVDFKQDSICKMPFNRLHVSCEGYLTLCCVDYQNYLALADLNTVSLRDAWSSSLFQEMRRRHLDKELAGTLCGNCWQGRRDRVSPLVPKLATELQYPDFYREVVGVTEDRLGGDSGSRAAVRRKHHPKT